jgi:hypothetical protein
MSCTARHLVLLAVCAAGLVPVTAAQAQWNGASRRPPPLYPYELQPGQPYAVEVAPGAYVIHRPSDQRVYPYAGPRVGSVPRRQHAAPKSTLKPKRTHADRGLIEELRRRHAQRAAKLAAKKAAQQAARQAKKFADTDEAAGLLPDKVIHTKRIVREKPLVIETRRVVEDPPKVIERRYYVDDVPAPPRRRHTGSIGPKRAGDDDPRVIRADAEITILGPDRMSIRLLRKDGQGLDANARTPQGK